MVVLGVLVGSWFAAMGAYAMTHAARSPESGAAHWMSTPTGRQLGGALSVLVGLAVACASLTWL